MNAWVLAFLVQTPAVDESRDAFREWQAAMLRDRAAGTEQLRRIAARKIVVPPPRVDGTPEPPPVRMDFGSVDPLGLLPGAPVVQVSIGDPTVRVKLQAKAGAFGLWAVEHKRLLWASADDGTSAFMDAETYQGLDVGPDGGFRPFGKVLFGVANHDVVVDGPKGGLELKSAWVGGEFSVDKDGRVGAELAVGPDLVPKALQGVAEARVQLSAELAAPLVVQDVQWRSPWGASQVASGAAAAVTRWIAGEQSCAYCTGKGSIVCRQCADRQIVACPGCARAGRTSCADCSGKGQLSCPTTKGCGRCSGSGLASCSSCSGSGSTTVTDTVPATETRWFKRPVHAGFDSNGNAILKMESYSVEVQTTKQVSRQVSCGSCGGSGRGGSCGRCGGAGTVVCGACDGTGRTACDECDGVGSKTCRTCRGSMDIECPTCEASLFSCPLCRGSGRIGR